MARAYLSLGSNIDPQKNLSSALIELHEQFGQLIVSPTYRCVAVGFSGPDFLNLAVGLDTDMQVVELNAWLHEMENRHGRDRTAARFSSRTLDVDIVLYDDLVMRGCGNLELPRPELKHAFVLKPLADIAPHVMHPTLRKTLAQLWREFPTEQETLVIETLALNQMMDKQV